MDAFKTVKISSLFTALALSAGLQAETVRHVQRGTHATVWSMFETKGQCETALTKSGQISIVEAVEPVLKELVQDQMPKATQISRHGGLIAFWDDLGQVREAGGELLAARLWNIQNSFYAEKTKSYSFGHAVKGQASIEEYVDLFSRNFMEGFQAFDISEEMKNKNSKANKNMLMSKALKLGLITAAALGTASLTDSMVASQIAAGAAFLAGAALPTPSTGRLRSFIFGDRRYRELVDHLGVSPQLMPWSANVVHPEEQVGSASEFYGEWPIAITTQAFEKMRKRDENRKQEMRRSCFVYSADLPCDEHTAHNELYHMNDLSFWQALSQTVMDKTESYHSALTIQGRIAILFYKDKTTNEPVLLHWIQFDIEPKNTGIKKTKESKQEQKQESFGWGGGLKPVAIPITR